MANFYQDNDDLRFYLEKYIDWEPIIRLTEGDFEMEDGHRSLAEANEFYSDILQMSGQFAADEIAPHWEKFEKNPIKLVDGEVIFPPVLQDIFDELAGLGMHGLCVPRELGGMNAPLFVYMANAEMFARADVGVMTHISFHCGIAMALLVYSVYEGTTEVDIEKKTFISTRFQEAISEIAEGKAWGCMDITEPNAGSDMAALRSKGVQDEDGNWFVTGQKIFITSGNGKYHIFIARTETPGDDDDAFAGLGGLSLFLVKLYDDNPDGTKTWLGNVTRVEEKLGHKTSPTCALDFENAPAELIGERGEGFKLMLILMNNARIGVAFEAIGISECALRMAREYAAQRPSMGKTIDRHEMIADYLDEMDIDIKAMRALAWHGAYCEELSQKTNIALQFGYEKDPEKVREMKRTLKECKAESRRVTPLGKYFGSEKAVQIAQRGIQIHGGVGYTKDYAAEKQLRDAMVLPIYEGTSQIQSLMVMKDTLGGIIKDPKGFLTEFAQTRWRSLSSRDPFEKRVAALQHMSLKAQRYLLTRTAASKFKEVSRLPFDKWMKELGKDWDPKRDFALAMLHAERLTKIITDATVAHLFLQQAKAHPEREEVLERWLHRAELRTKSLYEEITTTGDRILAQLAEQNAADAAAAE
ncbi:MAG: alkylation response protein AidB-like acyl-CoA dehydrogenase [Bradymonadia bacterium]|jgi:alkylation response protein AidB-like acyl-CoA dehydrogenase